MPLVWRLFFVEWWRLLPEPYKLQQSLYWRLHIFVRECKREHLFAHTSPRSSMSNVLSAFFPKRHSHMSAQLLPFTPKLLYQPPMNVYMKIPLSTLRSMLFCTVSSCKLFKGRTSPHAILWHKVFSVITPPSRCQFHKSLCAHTNHTSHTFCYSPVSQ